MGTPCISAERRMLAAVWLALLHQACGLLCLMYGLANIQFEVYCCCKFVHTGRIWCLNTCTLNTLHQALCH